MRFAWLLLLLPLAQAQEMHVVDPAGDVAAPPGTFGAYDLDGLGIEPRKATSFGAPFAWGVGIHGGSFDVVGAQTEAVARLHWGNGSLDHESMCLSLPAACYDGPLDFDPCGQSFWAEILWVRPDGTEQQMDRVPDVGSVVLDCPDQPSRAENEVPNDAPLAPESGPPDDPVEEAPLPLGILLVALVAATRRGA